MHEVYVVIDSPCTARHSLFTAPGNADYQTPPQPDKHTLQYSYSHTHPGPITATLHTKPGLCPVLHLVCVAYAAGAAGTGAGEAGATHCGSEAADHTGRAA